jgi:hypothetical protein
VQGLAPGAGSVLIRPGFSTGVQQNLDPEQPREMIGQSGFGGPGDKPGKENEREDQHRDKPAGHEKDDSRPD